MDSVTFSLPGLEGLQITLTEQADGSVRFDVRNEGDTLADLRGLFFDIGDEALLANLTVSGSDVTDVDLDANAVSNLGNGVNMNGVGLFDIGVEFGTAGIGADDIDGTFFTLSSTQGPLSIEQFLGVNFGVRLTSVEGDDGIRDDSLKLIGTSPDIWYPSEPPPM